MSGSDWTPVHYTDGEDPDNEPAKGPHAESKPERGKGEGKGTPVGLTLALPPEFISAMWGYGDNVLRLAIAVEENAKAILAMAKKGTE